MIVGKRLNTSIIGIVYKALKLMIPLVRNTSVAKDAVM